MILVLGSGSVGSLYGGLLAANGNEVVLLGRSFHIDVVRNNGLIIRGLFDFHVEPKYAGNFDYLYPILEDQCEDIDYILVTTKAHQTRAAAEEIIPIVPKTAVLISIQNGIGTEDILKELYPDNLVLRAVTSVGVNRPKPGLIDFTGEGQINLGYKTEEEKEIAKEFLRLLTKAGMNAKLTNNIEGMVYSKVILNCALNPLTAIHKVKNIEIIKQEKLKEEAIAIATEAWNVVKKMGIKISVKNPIDFMFEVIENTGENQNSMLDDILNKRKTEIEFLNGKIIELGEKMDINVSHNKEIYEKIRLIENSL